ncbi:MAG: Asp-tRNA(Asn)/Glu-tRNA(Gln) amidotransferase subunit GatC [Oligoflexales bacterium]
MKVEINEELIEKIASLAKLSLNVEEKTYYKSQFGKILSYFDELDAVVAKQGNEKSLAGTSTPERPDEVVQSCPVADVIALAPDKVGTAIQVPKIIE